MRNMNTIVTGTVLSLAALMLASPARSASDVAVKGKTVHTMAGRPISDGVVIVRDGKITAVGPARTEAQSGAPSSESARRNIRLRTTRMLQEASRRERRSGSASPLVSPR